MEVARCRVILVACTPLLFLAALAVSCSSTPKSPAPQIPGRGEPIPEGPGGTLGGDVHKPGQRPHGHDRPRVLRREGGARRRPHEFPAGLERVAESGQQALRGRRRGRTMPRVLEINFIDAAGNQLSGVVGALRGPGFPLQRAHDVPGNPPGRPIDGTFRIRVPRLSGQSQFRNARDLGPLGRLAKEGLEQGTINS